jgi:hypothetical protein
MKSYEKLLENNKSWARESIEKDPEQETQICTLFKKNKTEATYILAQYIIKKYNYK